MSGRGEVRVLCQDREEPQPESPRMPAWKREILERRRAKGGAGCGGGGGGTGATGTTQEGSPSSSAGGGASGAHRHNGSAMIVNGTKQDSSSSSGGGGGGNGRNYTITTASQHFGNNKEARHTAAERATSRGEDGEESLVLQESLGPLEENPFIKLEKERRRRQDRENATRPVQHILELYGSVPGIRTIRAENIIIIESDPEYFPDGGVSGSGASKWQQNGVSTYSSLNDLLDRRGSAVTEIRAKEVVIYDTTISKSEENLSTLGRSDHELQAYDAQGEGQGRVSRMLQKFDSNYGKLQKKSHSTENLLDLDCSSASGRPRLWSPKPDAVPKPRFEPPTPVLQSPPEAFKPKAEPESPQWTPTHSVYSFRQRFGDAGSPPKDETDCRPPKPTRERDWDSAADPRPKVPCSPDTRRARASESSPSNNKVLRSTPEFEIRPSPKPDLAGIPDSDPQARALANLRLQSKNSFMVIPKRRLVTVDSGPVKSSPSHRAVPTSPTTARANDYLKTTPIKTTVKSTSSELSKTPQKVRPTETSPVFTKRPLSPTKSPSSSPTKTPSSPTKTPSSPTKAPSSPTKAPSSPTKAPSSPTKAPSSPTKTPSSPTKTPSSPTKPVAKPVIVPATFFETPDSHSTSPTPAVASSSSPPSSPLAPLSPPTAADHHLPVTNIDDVEVEPPQRVPAPSPLVHRRKGNTFTVVPKRRSETDSPQQPQPGSPELQPEVGAEGTPSTPPQAPYSQLGTLLKKRYPAVEEIEVIGGYLSLEKSCLIKTGSTGKKLKISFNEASLQSTYEYPSETSAWDSDEEEEEDGRKDSPEEQPSMVGRIHIPRAGLGGSPLHPNNANDLSNYIPKHSVDYNTWQEQRIQESAVREETPQPTLVSEEVMLTPADSSSLSDFSSEPALYF